MAVDMLGHLLTLLVATADAQHRAQVSALAAQILATTGEVIEVAGVDQYDAGDGPAFVPPPPGEW